MAAAGQLLERPVIEPRHQFGDAAIELREAEETLVAQTRQDPALDEEDAGLGLGFVFRATGPGGENRRAVMSGQVAVRRVEFGLVVAGGGDAALEVVGDQQRRATADVFEGAHMAADPVRQTLAPGGFAVGVVGGTEDGDEDRRRPDLAARGVGDRHGLAGVVDEQFLAGGMRLAQAEREPPDPLPIEGAETAVAVAGRVLGFVFLPEEVEGDALAPQFAVHDRPIGIGASLVRRCRRRVQLRLERRLAQSCRQGPGDAVELRPAEEIADSRR